MGVAAVLQSRALRICFAYAAISMTISMTYKAVLSGYKYDSKFLMLSEQLAAALLFCSIAKRFLVGVPGLEVPDFSWEVLKRSGVSGTLFVGNIVVGWYGLQLVNIPLFLCIRRTTTAFTLVTEYLILGRKQSVAVIIAVLLIMLGALIAGWESLQSDWRGIGYTMANNVMTAVAMTVTKRFSDRHKAATTGFGMVYYNALVALPLSLLGATLFSEWSYNLQYPRIGEPGFWLAIVLASVMGLLMTYIALLCSTVNSPLVTSITGNVKDIAATVVGAAVFGDFVPTPYSVGGIVLSFVGAGLFSYAKLKESGALGGSNSSSNSNNITGGSAAVGATTTKAVEIVGNVICSSADHVKGPCCNGQDSGLVASASADLAVAAASGSSSSGDHKVDGLSSSNSSSSDFVTSGSGVRSGTPARIRGSATHSHSASSSSGSSSSSSAHSSRWHTPVMEQAVGDNSNYNDDPTRDGDIESQPLLMAPSSTTASSSGSAEVSRRASVKGETSYSSHDRSSSLAGGSATDYTSGGGTAASSNLVLAASPADISGRGAIVSRGAAQKQQQQPQSATKRFAV